VIILFLAFTLYCVTIKLNFQSKELGLAIRHELQKNIMQKTKLEEFKLIGISLGKKTTNENGQAAIDCGYLWQTFEKGDYANKIPGKLSDEVFAVYHDYDGDYPKPYSYFIGCKVQSGTEVPEGMDSLVIAPATYQQIAAKGKIPDCIINVWQTIWSMPDTNRAYLADFEVYDSRSKDETNAAVDVFLSLKD
jgi:predicted transcriptional regulator YdeE